MPQRTYELQVKGEQRENQAQSNLLIHLPTNNGVPSLVHSMSSHLPIGTTPKNAPKNSMARMKCFQSKFSHKPKLNCKDMALSLCVLSRHFMKYPCEQPSYWKKMSHGRGEFFSDNRAAWGMLQDITGDSTDGISLVCNQWLLGRLGWMPLTLFA
jgi:hypothetical protein